MSYFFQIRNMPRIRSKNNTEFLFIFKVWKQAHNKRHNCCHNAETGHKDRSVVEQILCTFLSIFFIFLCSVSLAQAKNNQVIKIAYITQTKKIPSALSNLDDFIQHKGLMGARIAIDDNNTTGQFTKQKYEIQEIILPISADIVQAFNTQVSADTAFVVTNLTAEQIKKLASLDSAKTKLFFDASTIADELRNDQCIDNLLHTLPSRAMRADALAQYMVKKQWTNWFLVTGMTQADQQYAKALKRAAKRFGIEIVTEKKWLHNFDARRTAQSDVPVFTQVDDYDVLIVADEKGLFGEYLDYRSWNPRPVIGTQGLVATSWHRTHEQWGAVQIQNRFREQAGRWMEEEDYGAYLAIRAIGEASVRTQSNQLLKVKKYLLDDNFALQGYKGKALSFRSWNGQLRQPILLAAARSMVSVAPIEGFLHPLTELDTLGFDQAESSCHNLQKSGTNQTQAPSSLNNKKEDNKWQKIVQQLINKFLK